MEELNWQFNKYLVFKGLVVVFVFNLNCFFLGDFTAARLHTSGLRVGPTSTQQSWSRPAVVSKHLKHQSPKRNVRLKKN